GRSPRPAGSWAGQGPTIRATGCSRGVPCCWLGMSWPEPLPGTEPAAGGRRGTRSQARARDLPGIPGTLPSAQGRWSDPTRRAAMAATPTPRPELTGATVVITGASSGLGRGVALALAASGANVVLAARRADLIEELAAKIIETGGNSLAVTTDVS